MSNTQSQTVNITLPKALLKQIDALAKRDYTSRSDIIRQTMLQRIRASAHLQKRTDLDEWGYEGSWVTVADFRDKQGRGIPSDAFLSELKTVIDGQSS